MSNLDQGRDLPESRDDKTRILHHAIDWRLYVVRAKGVVARRPVLEEPTRRRLELPDREIIKTWGVRIEDNDGGAARK